MTSESASLKERKRPMHQSCHRGVRVGVVVVASIMLASGEDMGCVVVVGITVLVFFWGVWFGFVFWSETTEGLVLFFSLKDCTYHVTKKKKKQNLFFKKKL